MIELLRIEQLALVDRVELEFGPGLNVVTGETGAGKSVVLGALGMLAGARGSAAAIREGADQAVVEAVFRTDRYSLCWRTTRASCGSEPPTVWPASTATRCSSSSTTRSSRRDSRTAR